MNANAVEFHGVTKRYKDFSVKDLHLTVPKGYVTGFIGPNGSGKTTTIQLMMDILQMDEGDIKLLGTSHKDHTIKQKIGFVYDDLYMYEDFTIKKMKRFIAPLYETWNEYLFQKLLKRLELPTKKKVNKFSKGMKMKTSLLFALSHEPEFIIMDEPSAGLDPIFRREFVALLQEIMVQENQTIFFSTHITTDLDQIADYIIFINKGKIVFQKSIEEINSNFHVVKGNKDMIDMDTKELFIGTQVNANGFTALFQGDTSIIEPFQQDIIIEKATIEDVMFFMTRKENKQS